MKSKMNAMMTIAMTYGITSRDASRVLQRDALQHLRDAHTTVGGPLERVVHLFPLEHFERIRVPREQITYRRVVDRVGFLFEFLHLHGLDTYVIFLNACLHTDPNALSVVDEYLC